MLCKSTIPALNLSFQRFLIFMCNFMRESPHQAAFIVVPLGIHSTSTGPELKRLIVQPNLWCNLTIKQILVGFIKNLRFFSLIYTKFYKNLEVYQNLHWIFSKMATFFEISAISDGKSIDTCQWRLITFRYVIMAPQFITCNYAVEKQVPLFSKLSEIIFASSDMYNTLLGSQQMWLARKNDQDRKIDFLKLTILWVNFMFFPKALVPDLCWAIFQDKQVSLSNSHSTRKYKFCPISFVTTLQKQWKKNAKISNK